MKTKSLNFILPGAGIVAWHFLFWREYWGINIALFTALILVSLSLAKGRSLFRGNVLVAAGGLCITSLLVVVNNTTASGLAYVIAVIVTAGFAANPSMRSLLNCLPASILGFFRAPWHLLRQVPVFDEFRYKYDRLFRIVRLLVIPGLILALFYVIFKIANPVFCRITGRIEAVVFRFIGSLFSQATLEWLLFTGFGLFVIIGVLSAPSNIFFTRADNSGKDEMVRKKRRYRLLAYFRYYRGLAGLKNENLAGTMLMLLMNLLLLAVNIIDINWLWFNFSYHPGMNLSQLVHEGTYLLIFSILLSMSIMLYFFRGNQNFLTVNRRLKSVAYAWLTQNFILGISVAVRNYHYIQHYGLSYKRIGVIFFLLLVFTGLILVFVKIKYRKSLFFLFRTNAWSLYAAVLLLACFNWDPVIARVNLGLARTEKTDVPFLLNLSWKALPVLMDHESELREQMPGEAVTQAILKKKTELLCRTRTASWLSWNLADQRVKDRIIKGSDKNKGL